ncbi:MAG: hypothetical protein ACP5VP_12165 [Candidatus Limnocylindrales bacterium]
MPRGSVERIDPTSGRVTERIAVGWAPEYLAAYGDSLWVSNTTGDGSQPRSPDLNTVARIDLASEDVVLTAPVLLPGLITAGPLGAWVVSAQQSLVHIVLASGRALGTVRLATGLPVSLALFGGRVWVVLAHTGSSATLQVIDPASDTVVRTVEVAEDITWLVPTPTALFATVQTGRSSFSWVRLDPQTSQPTTLGPLPAHPAQFEGVAITAEGAWLLSSGGPVIPFDPRTGAQDGTAVEPPDAPPGGGCAAMIAIGRDVWVVCGRAVDEIHF